MEAAAECHCAMQDSHMPTTGTQLQMHRLPQAHTINTGACTKGPALQQKDSAALLKITRPCRAPAFQTKWFLVRPPAASRCVWTAACHSSSISSYTSSQRNQQHARCCANNSTQPASKKSKHGAAKMAAAAAQKVQSVRLAC